MNGVGGAAVWAEIKDPSSGRPYFYKKGTNETSWNKPDELLTPAQRATGWSQTSTAEGKVYWYNKSNKTQTSWNAPPGWDEPPPRMDEPPPFDRNPGGYGSRDQPRDFGQRDEYRPRQYDSGGYRGAAATTQTGYENATEEEREEAFTKLLRKVGVKSDWTWEETIRAAVQDPAFRALRDATDRREAFEQYQHDVKRQDAEKERERQAKLRKDFRAMLQRHPEVQRYSRWKNVQPLIEHEAVYKSTSDDDERKRLFQEYVAELQQDYQEKRFQDHYTAMKELKGLMSEVNITPETRWAQAQKMVDNNESFMDEKYSTLTRSEILDTFTTHIRHLWDDVNNVKQQNKTLEAREARKAREGFRDLLHELQDKDILKADSTWKSILPHVVNDDRFDALLSNVRTGDPRYDGSTPQDYFFDAIDELDREMRDLVAEAEKALKDARYKPSLDLTLSELESAVRSSKHLSSLSHAQLESVHARLLARIASSLEDEAANEARKEKKRAVDALRSRIKRLDPPVGLDDTWDIIRPRVERLEEYAALSSEEDRRAAFEKHISRLQEDYDRDRRHRRKDRDRSRERRRDDGARQEDAYAEDRRRAMEQRERQYRRASGSANGLSPPPRERRRDDRKSLDDPRGGRYDRERRERDAERERAYVSRADPYSSRVGGGDLDYGDDGASVGERKRGGDEAGGREKKRARVDGEAGEEMEVDKKEEVALQSGSEEGEIEEV